MSGGPVILRYLAEQRGRRERRKNLEARGVVERAKHLSDQRPSRDATPDAATQISQRTRATVYACNFHRPGSRANIKAGLADALQCASEINAANAPGQQVRDACERATAEPGEKGALASLVVGQASGEEAARQGDDRERSDDETDGAVRTTEVVAHVRRKSWQNCAETKKAEKCCGDQAPKASRQ